MTATSPSTVERSISAVFKHREQIDKVIQQLLDQGISPDDVSVMGKNFHSETRISGFITKRDVILQGLRRGGVFGS
ncbi:MAG TPA: general stress protein, partial [Candidatus Caenarcaniphilales bacterium]